MNDLTLFTDNIFLLILSINLIPIIILFFSIPITLLRRYQNLLTIFLSFASGGLMADVFLRLLPYMVVSYKDSNRTHSESHGDNRTGLVILVGIFLSFFIEKFVRHFQSKFYIKQFSYVKPVHKDDRDEEQANTTLAYLYLLADILYSYTNSLNLSSIFIKKSDSTLIIIKIIYQVLHLFSGYAILIYSGMTSAKVNRF